MTNSYSPDEPAAAIWFEQTNLAAVFIGAIAYGIQIVVFFACVYFLVMEKRKHYWQWLTFVCLLFLLSTVNICMNMHFTEMTWIDDRNYPGGPLAFLLEQSANAINTAGNSATLVTQFLADGVLLYRVHVIWGKWYISVVPAFMWFASTVLSVLTTIQAARPASSLWADNTLDFSVPYWALSMALNILLTILLVSRLLHMRAQIAHSVLGAAFGKPYVGVAAMILESALPYCLVSFIFIVLYGIHNPAENLFIPLICQVQCIAPELIVLRVARGRAWAHDTLSSATAAAAETIQFNHKPEAPHAGVVGQRRRMPELSMITFKAGQDQSTTQMPSIDSAMV